MKLHRAHSWLLTSCVLLAATPTYAQYGQPGHAPYGQPGYASTLPVTSTPLAPNWRYQVVNPLPSIHLNSNVRNPYQVAPNPYAPNPYAPNPYAPPHGNSDGFRPGQAPNAVGDYGNVHSPTAAAAPWPYQPQLVPQGGSQAVRPLPAATYQHAFPSVSHGVNQHYGVNQHRSVNQHHGVNQHYANHRDPSHHDSGNDVQLDDQATLRNPTQPWKKSAACSTCGDMACGGTGCAGGICAPNNGLYFQYDRIYWSISAPDVTDIGHAPSERIVTTPAGITLFYQNDLDTSFLDGDFSTGDRFDFGYLNGCSGWAASVLYVKQGQGISATGVSYVPFDPDGLMSGYQDANADTFDDDIDFDNLFGRHGEDLGTPDGAGGFIAPFDGTPDTPAPADTGDLVTYLVTFGSMSAANSTEMTGAELMSIYRTAGSNCDNTVDCYYGMRYLQIRDRFLISASGGFLDAMSLDTDVDNDIVGPQIGARWAHRTGSMVMSVEGRFMAGFNFQRSEQRGSVATNASPGGQNAPVSLTAHSTSRATTDEQFAPLGELRVDMAYKINRVVAVRLGYTALVTSGIGRASEQVIYSLPDFGLNAAADNDQTLFSNALTFGLELNR